MAMWGTCPQECCPRYGIVKETKRYKCYAIADIALQSKFNRHDISSLQDRNHVLRYKIERYGQFRRRCYSFIMQFGYSAYPISTLKTENIQC